MLKPAILYKQEIATGMQHYFYTDDMMFETGSIMSNWTPNITENPEDGTEQWAIVDSKNNCIGFVTYYIDWYASCASRFGLMSFDRGNPLIGKALHDLMNMLIYNYRLHRIEFRMIGGNPVEKHYDKFCQKYNGNKVVLHDSLRDRQGNYHNDVIYEIILEENNGRK